MKRSILHFLMSSLGAIVLGLSVDPAFAQAYPAKPVRVVVPYEAGGPVDTVAREAAQRMFDGASPVIVDNKPGAATIIGADFVAKSAPDGYTLLMTTGAAVSINQHLFSKLPYDPDKDFTAVIMLVSNPYVLFAHPSVPIGNFKELVAYGKANPEKLNVALTGNGTPPHLALKLIESVTGARFTSVHYKGTPAAMADILTGRVDLMLTAPAIPLRHLQAGKLKSIAMTSKMRFPDLPDVPTIAETYPGFEASSWYGIVAPAATPRPIVLRLNAELQKYAKDPVAQKKLLGQGWFMQGGTPDEFAAHIRAETARWGAVIRQYNIKVD